MTTITTTCSGCGRELSVPDRYQGRDLKCPDCGRAFRVEVPAVAVPEPALPATPRALPEAPAPFPSVPDTAPFAEQPAAAEEPGPSAAVETAPVYWRLKSLGVLSTGIVGALVNALLGLLAGLLVAVVSLTPASVAIPFVHGPVAAVLAIVVLPLVYGAIGFVSGAVLAVVYNLAARLVGGVKVLLE